MSTPISIAVLGSTNADLVVTLPRLPQPGETVLGKQFVVAPGGKGANQAVAAAKLGARTHLIACVGNDSFADICLASLRDAGVITDYVRREPNLATGVALIAVDEQGENSIAVAPGANQALRQADVDAAVNVIRKAKALILQLEVPIETVMYAAKVAREARVSVVLNPAPALPVPDYLLRTIDVLTPNGHELAQLSGVSGSLQESARALISRGVKRIIVTMGPQGVAYYSEGESGRVPAMPVKVVDTTAAGDAFTGALTVALAEGKPLAEAVRFANAAGAASTTRLGAQPSMPSREEVERLLG